VACLGFYPLFYALVLRCRNGIWPSETEVWGSLREKEEERLERGIAGDFSLNKGLREIIITPLRYTMVGSACLSVAGRLNWREPVGETSDLEKAEAGMAKWNGLDEKTPLLENV